jgi:hypothetical protein
MGALESIRTGVSDESNETTRSAAPLSAVSRIREYYRPMTLGCSWAGHKERSTQGNPAHLCRALFGATSSCRSYADYRSVMCPTLSYGCTIEGRRSLGRQSCSPKGHCASEGQQESPVADKRAAALQVRFKSGRRCILYAGALVRCNCLVICRLMGSFVPEGVAPSEIKN